MTTVGNTTAMRKFGRAGALGQGMLRLGLLGLAVMLGACSSAGQGTGGGVFASDGNAQSTDMDTATRALWTSSLEAEKGHNYELAISALANLAERQPENIQVLTALLRNLRYGGRAVDAVSYVDQRAAHLLSDPGVKFEYAKAQLDAGRKVDALNSLREVAVLMAGNWKVHSALGIAFDSSGQFDNAIAAYQTALRLSPDNAVVMNNLAISQAMAGRLQAAIKTLEAAAAINRTNTHVRQNLALLYAANGESEKARALAAMDLGSSDLETNLSFYRRFGGDMP